MIDTVPATDADWQGLPSRVLGRTDRGSEFFGYDSTYLEKTSRRHWWNLRRLQLRKEFRKWKRLHVMEIRVTVSVRGIIEQFSTLHLGF